MYLPNGPQIIFAVIKQGGYVDAFNQAARQELWGSDL